MTQKGRPKIIRSGRPKSSGRLIDISNSISLENWVVWPKDFFQTIINKTILKQQGSGNLSYSKKEIDSAVSGDGSCELSAAIINLSKDIADQLFKQLPFDRISYIIEYEQTNSSQHVMIKHIWGNSFEAVKHHWFIARDIYSYIYNNHISNRNKFRKEAIGSIVTRSLLVYREIIVLCEGGFPDGAMARWRTLYELYVTFAALNKLGKNTYELYLVSEKVNSLRYMESVQRRQVGEDKKLEKIINDLKDIRIKYGKCITDDFGWAAIVLGKSRVNLRDLEVLIQSENQRPSFRHASSLIHSTHLRPEQLLGYPEWSGSSGPLIGPSPYGINLALQEAVGTLSLIMLELIGIKYTFDTIILMQLMLKNKIRIDKEIKTSSKMMREYTRNVDDDWVS